MTRYKIQVKSVTGAVLVYHIDEFPGYKIEEDFIVFTDTRTQEIKRFHTSNCEITEVKE